MNMTTTITTKNGQQLARPLKVLVPLIKRDVENAEYAGRMFYVSAGGKLVEARTKFEEDKNKTSRKAAMEFWDWFRDQGFKFSHDSAQRWMGWWEAENVRGEQYETQEDFRRATQPASVKPRRPERDYDEPVHRIVSGVNAKEMRDRALTAAKEHELERKLANQLIKIGYGVLATKLHPDKGGSHDAMRRLTKVAKALREVYN
jgi:hypothetical protein